MSKLDELIVCSENVGERQTTSAREEQEKLKKEVLELIELPIAINRLSDLFEFYLVEAYGYKN